MKLSKLLILALIAVTPQLLKADDTCNQNPRRKLAADTLSKRISREIRELPGGLEGFVSLEVRDVGSGEVCGYQWDRKALDLGHFDIGQFPTCGVVYYFSDENALKSFAKSSIALQSPSALQQGLIREGHTGHSVGPDDTETYYVPVCAALKK